ncbi:hypothetical protein [uncultured Dysosmobacter sp.]|uniref:hypothetical protein n=1 Tax=uncultured Dysosmobacter sp. TaxID=2591384 RepID=UPI002624D95C|nr:hypothetical protein [uncultured Dysosmobacter sp.]
MRKLMKIAVVLGLALSLTCTAFALSPSAVVGVGKAVGANGRAVTVRESAPTVTPTATQAVEVLKDVAPAGTKAEDLSVVYSMDLSVPARDLPVTITFEVKGAKASDDVYVLHFDGSAWEVVASGKGGTIDATFTSLSPVAVVLQAAATTTPGTGAGSDKHIAPQTGVDMTMLYAGIAVFVAAGAVALVTSKKRSA